MNEAAANPAPPEPAKSVPGIAQSLALLALFLAALGATAIVLNVLQRLTGAHLSWSARFLVQQLVSWPLVLWVGLRWSRMSFREAFPLTCFPVHIVPALVIADFGSTILLTEIVQSILPVPEAIESMMTERLAEGGMPARVVSAALVAPLAEELFFRGLVLRGYLGRYPVSKAIWASAFLFAVLHLNPWQGFIALPMGVVCAWLVLKTGSLVPAILVHSTCNVSASVLFPPLLWVLGYDTGAIRGLEHYPAVMLAIGGAMALGGGFVFYRQVGGMQDRRVGPRWSGTPVG